MRPLAICLFWLLAIALSCQRPAEVPAESVYYSVPAELEPYVQRFRDEAQKRGKTPAINNLIVVFGQTSQQDICGECMLEPGKTPRVVLAQTAFCWQQASPQARECLVFHELGHCLLKRAHTTKQFPNGAFVSLMNPDDRAVYATCVYPIGNDDCDKRPRRDYYVDELFDASTPAPAWGR